MIAIPALLAVGLLVAIFVGYNIGGSSTGVAFGPAVGSRIVGKAAAAGIFTAFALVGGWTIGRNVIETMSEGIVPQSQFTLAVSIVVLFFAGGGLLVSNVFGVPASTSMTAVGAIAGLGIATNTLDEQVMFAILAAWIIAPAVAFSVGLVIGRYVYPHLDARISFTRFQGGLVRLDRSGSGHLPTPTLNENAAPRDVLGALIVVIIACYNAFSAGASNAANAIAPLVGNGSITASQGIVLAIAAIGVGSFTIARRTLDTIGEGITDLPILAAMIVSLVGATIITVLSGLGIPASLAVSMTSCIIGLGWGRSSRVVTLAEATSVALEKGGAEATDVVLKKEDRPEFSADAILAESGKSNSDSNPARGPTVGELATGEDEDQTEQQDTEREPIEVPGIGEEEPEEVLEETPVLFDRVATGRVVFLWLLTPTISTIGSYTIFVLFF
ncbi:inorganic phosphate transporter [Halocatena marina]|uniref:inorganic phosphate transporter n=1 Tax=Halocatena marina TaxID=2934937 RepID=UPI00200DCDF6|nr:inorganic phosphate transporter [Halocatena marina]